ncbi:MAG TPA: hypothetical protein VN775_06620 [Opitutaceae bacterium]|nr:hypothetical protein [Opitutaceae bacterium]
MASIPPVDGEDPLNLAAGPVRPASRAAEARLPHPDRLTLGSHPILG